MALSTLLPAPSPLDALLSASPPPDDAATLSVLSRAFPDCTHGELAPLLVALGPHLTSPDGHARRRATAVLAVALDRSAARPALLARPPRRLRSLLAFVLERLASDFPSALPCLRACRALLRAVADATDEEEAGRDGGAGTAGGDGSGGGDDDDASPPPAVAVCRAVFRELNVQACEQPLRNAAYQLFEHVLSTAPHARALRGLSMRARVPPGGAAVATAAAAAPPRDSFALDFAAGFVRAMDGEKDPRCLLVCLRCAALLLAPPFGDATAPLAEELFDVTACYFPISFSPPPNDPYGITREQLSAALAAVFSAAPRLAPFVLPLLLEKLASSVADAKREALRTLRACAPAFGVTGLAPHLVDVASALRRELVGSRGEPGAAAASYASTSSSSPFLSSSFSAWTATTAAEGAQRIGAEMGAVGLNFSGPRAAQDGAGYALFSQGLSLNAAAAAPAAITSSQHAVRVGFAAPAGTLSAADDALDAICEVTRLLAAAEASACAEALASGARAPGASQAWSDFAALTLRSSIIEVERAAETPAARGSARVLCAAASAHQFALGVVLGLAMPVLAEVHADAQAHGRHAVHSAALALLAGLLHAADTSLDYSAAELNPWSRFAPLALDMLLQALGDPDADAAVAPHSVGPVLAGVAPVVEKRCIAVAGLCDLCARPPSPLLSPRQLTSVILRFTAVILGESGDGCGNVRIACVRALCSMASSREHLAAAVLADCVPLLLRAVAASPSAAAREVPLHALTQLCSAASPVVRNSVVPRLLGLIDGEEPSARSLVGDVFAALSRVAVARAGAGDVEAVDSFFVSAVAPASLAADAAPMQVLVPALLRLLKASAEHAALQLSMRALASMEQTLRVLATHASAPLQDALRVCIVQLLCGEPSSGFAFDSPLVATPVSLFAPLQPGASTAQKRVLPVLLTALACGRADAPVPPRLAALMQMLASAALNMPLSTPLLSCEDPLQGSLAAHSQAQQQQVLQQPLEHQRAEVDEVVDETALAEALCSRFRGERTAAVEGAGEAPPEYLLARAAVVCAVAVGALLNKHATDAAGGAEAVTCLERTVSAALAAGPQDLRERERGVLLCVWAAKGLAMRSHAAAPRLVSLLTDLLVHEESGAVDAAHVALAGTGLGLLLQNCPRGFALSREAGATVSGLYKQRIFEGLMTLYSGGGRAGSAPLVLCLCSAAQQLPPAVLLAPTTLARLLPLVLRALEFVEGEVADNADAASAGGAGLRDAVLLQALLALRTLVVRAAAAVAASPHLAALVHLLLGFSRLRACSRRALARATAVDCLRGLAAGTGVPYFRLHPLRSAVVLGLVAALDDPRRAVRRRAAAARSDWCTLAA